jgi:hypothetical protein
VAHEWIFLTFAALVALIPVIVVFLIAPGGLLVRLASSLTALASVLIASGLVWYLDLPPSEPLAAVLAGASLFAGWRLAKFLNGRLNEKPAAGETTKSPTAGLRKNP